jgi:membrane protease subunit (stomatin/prohibitin family)
MINVFSKRGKSSQAFIKAMRTGAQMQRSQMQRSAAAKKAAYKFRRFWVEKLNFHLPCVMNNRLKMESAIFALFEPSCITIIINHIL